MLEAIFSRDDLMNHVFDVDVLYHQVILKLKYNDWDPNIKVTFGLRKIDEDKFKVIVVQKPTELDEIEWYIGPTRFKKDYIKFTISNTLGVFQFLQNSIKDIDEAQNAIG